jgi:hypothetical protein
MASGERTNIPHDGGGENRTDAFAFYKIGGLRLLSSSGYPSK